MGLKIETANPEVNSSGFSHSCLFATALISYNYLLIIWWKGTVDVAIYLDRRTL